MDDSLWRRLVDERQARLAKQTAARLDNCPAARAAFDVARDYCGVPMLAVGIVEPTRIYLPLRHGIDHETLPPTAIAMHLVETGEALLVTDARRDPRFLEHALVRSAPYARVIAAAPLYAEGPRPVGGVVGFDPGERRDGVKIRRRLERVAQLITAVLAIGRPAVVVDASLRRGGRGVTDEALQALESEEARRVVSRLGRRWGLQILLSIGRRRSARFNRIAQDLPGINSRTLSDRLRELEEDRFVTRRQFSQVPVRVEYSLTPAGEHLLESLFSLLEPRPTEDEGGADVTS